MANETAGRQHRAATQAGPAAEATKQIVPVRHPLRWVSVAIVLLLGAMLAHLLVADTLLQWPVVGQYLFSRPILDGLLITIELTATAMAIGLAVGLVVALMRLSPNPILSWCAQAYIWAFRGVPTLVQLIFWFNLAIFLPKLSFGIPFGPSFISASSNSLITPLIAANLGLGLNEGAYMAEIVRSGISSVNIGQTEAAMSLGMRRMQAMRVIILPQALRVIVPPIGNDVIAMLKYTSLASVISVTELLQSAQLIYQRTYQTVPLLIVASCWYLALTSALTLVQRVVERRLGRGTAGLARQPRGLSGLARRPGRRPTSAPAG